MLFKWCKNTPLKICNIVFFITIVFSSFTQLSLASDSIKVEKLTQINKLLQDNKGFIWLAGMQGITRFDGESSIRFSFEDASYPLPFTWINDFVLSNDLLILATETHGLFSLNINNGESFPLVTDSSIISTDNITIFKKNYYFSSGGSLYKYQPNTGSIQIIATGITILEVNHTDDNLYVRTGSGLYKLEDEQLTSVLNHQINTSITFDDKIIAITSNNILAIKDNGKTVSVPVSSGIYKATKAFNTDSFFTLNASGDIDKYSINNLSKKHHGFSKIDATRVTSMLHDRSGVLWLANNQIVKRLHENTIKGHTKKFDIANNANEIALLDNKIIMGTYGAGLQNLFTNTFSNKTNSNFTNKSLTITGLEISKHILYIATFDGVWQFDNATNKVTRLPFKDNNKLALRVKHRGNLLYIATDGDGLYAYDLSTQELIWNINSSDGLSSNEVIDILPLDSGNIWLATAQGIDIYDSYSGTIKNINIPDGNKLVSVAFANNKIFAASLGNGVFVFNKSGDLLDHMGKGISFSHLLSHNNEIWASARPGIYRLSAINHQLSMIDNTADYTFVGSSVIRNNVLYSSYYGGVLELDLTEKPTFHPNVLISKTTISGKSYLLNKTINVRSSNDLITLDLASLDYRPGMTKRFQYSINNSAWQTISGSQLTLTGLASGDYNIEIMATNSLGQWSDIKAYTDIHVAYPWYWTSNIKAFYVLLIIFITLLASWLLYLRTQSINHIHNLLRNDMRNYGRLMKDTERNLGLTLNSIKNDDITQTQSLVEKTLLSLKNVVKEQEPDNLADSDLATAIPFFANYIHNKYDVKLHANLDEKIDELSYELKADIYKVIFEAIISSIFKSSSIKFDLSLQKVKEKVWLTITSDNNSFSDFDSKINFDLSSYTIRQLANKNKASLNTFKNDDGSTQLVISFPLMHLS